MVDIDTVFEEEEEETPELFDDHLQGVESDPDLLVEDDILEEFFDFTLYQHDVEGEAQEESHQCNAETGKRSREW